MSSFKCTGVGKLWVYAALSSVGVSLTVNSLLKPMSNLWRGNISLYSTNISSTRSIYSSVNVLSSQLKICKQYWRCSSTLVGSNFSNLSSSRNSAHNSRLYRRMCGRVPRVLWRWEPIVVFYILIPGLFQ